MSARPVRPNRPDATELLDQLKAGQTSAEKLVREHLQTLEMSQPYVNGATRIYRKQAISEAQRLDESGDRSLPLFGLPCSVKETFGIAGEDVTAGSMRMPPQHHYQDAEIVRRLRKAGAVVIARSNVPEFAMTGESSNPRFGRTNNPLDVSRAAGGSSGGEGALVGSGATVFGVGSDILGSIRIPAAFCGVTGFKPHFEAVDGTGTWPAVNGFTAEWLGLGPIARSVRDALCVYNVIAHEPVAVASSPGRLIELKDFPFTCRQPCLQAAATVARQALRDAGYQDDRRDYPEASRLYLKIPQIILHDFHDDWLRQLTTSEGERLRLPREVLAQLRGEGSIDPGLLMWLLMAPVMKPRRRSVVEKITHRFREARTRVHDMLADDGVIVMPTLGVVAPKHGQMNRISLRPGVNRLFTAHTLGNYANLPSISVPAWRHVDEVSGLPASVMLMGRPGAEAQLFHAAQIVERAVND